MKNISITVGASTYDIELAGNSLTGGSGIAFRDLAADGLSNLAFSTNQRFTGGAFDNITVSQIPEPATALLGGLAFLMLLRRRR